jgi:hypothetical protein
MNYMPICIFTGAATTCADPRPRASHPADSAAQELAPQRRLLARSPGFAGGPCFQVVSCRRVRKLFSQVYT